MLLSVTAASAEPSPFLKCSQLHLPDAPNGVPCAVDDDPCNGIGVCIDGDCHPTAATTPLAYGAKCSKGACYVGFCEDGGCHIVIGETEGDPCTPKGSFGRQISHACAVSLSGTCNNEGSCVGAEYHEEGAWCQTSNPCAPDGVCTLHPNLGFDCYATISNTDPLFGSVCSPAFGCWERGHCVHGDCEAKWSCEDGNPCTDETCVEDACVFENVPDPQLTLGLSGPNYEGTHCDDGDPCTTEMCVAGACRVMRFDLSNRDCDLPVLPGTTTTQ